MRRHEKNIEPIFSKRPVYHINVSWCSASTTHTHTHQHNMAGYNHIHIKVTCHELATFSILKTINIVENLI